MEEEIITPEEEEIITPEENVFDYNKLRYILDKDGYVFHASLGGLIICDLGECIEYTGEIPDGYDDLFKWYDETVSNNSLNAWKIVDGNLVYDEKRYNDLQALYKQQEEENSCASHKWVNDKLRISNSVVTDELSNVKTGTSLIVLNDAGDYEIPELKVESAAIARVNVISSNKNILGIDAISSNVNGVDININNDGTITLNGTSTDVIDFNLNGSNTNTDMLYIIEKNINYAISGLTDNVSLSLYSYDGTDRTYVGNYINQSFNLTEAFKITQTVLSIPSGAAFENVVISPQIEIGEATGFTKHAETNAIGVLEDNECVITGLMSYSDKTIIMLDKEVSSSVKYFRYKYLNEKFAEIEVNENEVKSIVTEMNGTIDQQNTAISQISQTVNEIKSDISDIADVTISADGFGSVSLDKVNESEPIYIKIYPTDEDISYLYPNDDLFPSDNLFSKGRTLRFKNGDYVIDYELPDDLLYYDENNYDEFILDYDAQTCEINKRVGFNADGSKYLLEKPITISYEYPTIPLPAGDYTVTMLDYNKAFMFIRMMVENLYTSQFATKVELHSSIKQTKDNISSEVSANYATKKELVNTQSTIEQTTNSINLEVSKKVNNADYTSAQILMKINDDTSSTVIKSSKLDVDAIATFTNSKLAKAGATVINGANITTGTISCDRLSGGTISGQTISGGSITGASVSTGYFSVNSKGALKYYHSPGFLVCATGGSTYHPYVSSLNIAYSGGNVLSFRSGTTYSNSGSEVAYITTDKEGDDYNLNLQAHHGAVQLMSNAYMYLYSKIDLVASGTAGVWATGSGLSSGRVLTDSGSASSKCLKENFKEFTNEDYNSALKLLKNMKLQEYDYKYNMYKDKHQYGFVIDELEENEDCNKWFKFTDNYAKVDGDKLDASVIDDKDFNKEADDILHYKNYDSDVLDKYLLTCIKALQNKIEVLEEEIKSLKESDNNGKN